MVLHPFGHPRREAGPKQVGPIIHHQFLEPDKADHPLDLDHFGILDVQLVHDLGLEVGRRARADLKPHHLAPAAALERGFEFAHQVFGLFLDLQIAVAQHAEQAGPRQFVARKQRPDMQAQQVFERQEPHLPLGGGQADEAVDLAGNGQ